MFSSVRNRLAVLFFVITAAAVGIVYLYVVPQLRSSLTAQKLQRLEREGTQEGARVSAAVRRGDSRVELRGVLQGVARRTDARVALLEIPPGGGAPRPILVVGGSGGAGAGPSYPSADAAVAQEGVASGVEDVNGTRMAETAVPVSGAGPPRRVTALSTPLVDVDDDVAVIRRQILIAGGIALVAALAAGWLAARAHAKRLRLLDAAARKVAEGDFATPIPIQGSDEVGQLGKTLDEMRERLELLDSARRDFIANASHELRTPIFSLGGFVELLDEDEPDPAVRAEFVRTMREQVARLTKLTADLLDLSKLDSGAMEIDAEQVDLGELAKAVAGEFRPAAERHDSAIAVNGSADPTAMGDQDRVAQIMRILLDNALTHTPEGTSISVTAQRHGGAASLVVRDDGPGIGAHERVRVFDRFYTGDRVSGSGLGLAIARELALRMDGDLVLSSTEGETAFSLRLPAPGDEGATG